MKREAAWEVSGLVGLSLVIVASALGACDGDRSGRVQASKVTSSQPALQPILVDGSSTVHLLSEGIVDLYASRMTTDIKLDVSGTGGGFKKFCRQQTDINGASRPITAAEQKLCEENAVSFVELPVAYDGVAVVVPRSNEWLHALTVKELRKIWSARSQGTVMSWHDVNESYPNEPLHLYAPGIDSGTFDFFNEAVLAEDGIRADYASSENDHEIAQAIAADRLAIGYFGLAYQQRYDKQLRLVPIDDENPDNGAGAITPSAESISQGQYAPLSRPLFVYVNRKSLDRTEVNAFVESYVKTARLVAPDVGYIGLGHDLINLATKRLHERQLGSVFDGVHSIVGLTLSDLMSAESDAIRVEDRRTAER